MRVLLTIPSVAGHHVTHARQLTRFLVESGDTVVLAAPFPSARLEPVANAGATLVSRWSTPEAELYDRSFPARQWRLFRFFLFCEETAESRGCDVVHHTSVNRAEVPLLAAVGRATLRRKSGLRRFATLFRTSLVAAPGLAESLPRSLWRRARSRAMRRLWRARCLDRVFVHAESMALDLTRHLGVPAGESWFVTVPDPIEFVDPGVSRADARRLLGLPDGAAIALFFGVPSHVKGVDVFVRAGDHWVSASTLGLVVGEATAAQATALRAQAARSSHPERIELRPGRVSDHDMFLYFVASDVVVLPYRPVHTGTSGVLQHAAAAGRPVVASHGGPVADTVRRHELGSLTPPDSPAELAAAVEDVLSRGDEWRAGVAHRGRAYAAACDWRVACAEMRRCYEGAG